MACYSVLGEEIQCPTVSNCYHGNTSGRQPLIVTVVIQLWDPQEMNSTFTPQKCQLPPFGGDPLKD